MPAIFPFVGRVFVQDVLLVDDPWAFRLFKNDIPVDEETVLGDLVECDYSGYLPVPGDWGDVYEDADGRAVVDSDLLVFLQDGGPIGNFAYGYFVTPTDGTALIFVERFDAPRLMAFAGHTIKLLPRRLVGDLAPP